MATCSLSAGGRPLPAVVVCAVRLLGGVVDRGSQLRLGAIARYAGLGGGDVAPTNVGP